MSGEIPGMRAAREKMANDMRNQGNSEAFIKRTVDKVTRTADANIRAGKQPKPKIKD